MSSEKDLDEFLQECLGSKPRTPEVAVAATSRGQPPQEDWAKVLASASCWARSGDSYFPVNSVVNTVPPGAFRVAMSNQGPYLNKMAINIDNLLALPDSATEVLLEEFSQFWRLKPAFDKRGFTFKRGMLMWGPPGSGKTSAIWQMTQKLVKDQKGIVLFVEEPNYVIWMLTLLRRIEPDRPVVIVYEDIDAIIQNHGEHQLLALLDGEFQTNNVIHIATTNYPGRLDRRFIDRPSRFDTIMKIGMPTAAARRVYFMNKEPELTEETLERWVEKTDGYSVAHLREVCIATQCLMQSEEQVFTRLDKMKRSTYELNDEGEERNQIGFGGIAELVRKKR